MKWLVREKLAPTPYAKVSKDEHDGLQPALGKYFFLNKFSAGRDVSMKYFK